jgi:hypothetical protein
VKHIEDYVEYIASERYSQPTPDDRTFIVKLMLQTAEAQYKSQPSKGLASAIQRLKTQLDKNRS